MYKNSHSRLKLLGLRNKIEKSAGKSLLILAPHFGELSPILL